MQLSGSQRKELLQAIKGNDLEECLEFVHETRSKAQF